MGLDRSDSGDTKLSSVITGDCREVDAGLGADTLIWDPPRDAEFAPAGGP